MKNRSIFLILLIVCMFVFSACSAGKDYPDWDEIPLEEDIYVFDECVFLVGWSSITKETMTQMKKGEIALDRADTSIYYRQVWVYHNLDETSFDFVDESKLNKSDIIMRFDVYYEGNFSGSTIFVDKDEQIYLAYLGRYGSNTKYQFYEIWKITLDD